MGPPGSGKGTQVRLLRDAHGWEHLSTGDLFRDHLRLGTPLGRVAEQHISQGHYVPDEVTVGMVRERLARIPRTRRIVFDGFPRTVAQATALDELLGERGRSVGSVVLLEVPPAALLARLSSRGRSGDRSDDSPEVIGERLAVYEEQTRPVVDHYERAGLLRRVDGVGDVDRIRERVARAIS
ncbi:MAG: adenylate kinase [Candidatus Limnocylindria bacterium]